MTETNYATRDSPQLTRWNSLKKSRVIAFALLFVLTIALVVWIETNSWGQMERLKKDFAAANLESFYLGVGLRESILRMNGALFRYQLSEDAGERDRFHKEARGVTERIGQSRIRLGTTMERALIEEIEKAYELYLTDTAELLERGIRGIRRDTASQVNEQLSKKSETLLLLADKLVEAQRLAFARFFGSSGGVLASLQQLL